MTHPYDHPMDVCQLCGGRELLRHHEDFRGNTIDRCADCGIQFMNPQYTKAHLDDFYASYIFDEPQWDEPRRACAEFYLDLITRHGGRPPRRILDVGCGQGHMLRVAGHRGIEAVGYDVDPETTSRIAREVGVLVRSGIFHAIEWPSQHFDLVYMNQVIEHVKEPMPILSTIERVLQPGGILFMALPNIHSLSARVKFRLEKLGLKRNRVGAYYDTSHHLWYYTPDTLLALLKRRGYEILHVRSVHRVRPGQPMWRRLLARNTTELFLGKSGFVVIARRAVAEKLPELKRAAIGSPAAIAE